MSRAKKPHAAPEPAHIVKQRELLMSIVERACELDDGPSQDAMLEAVKFDAPGWTNDDIREVFSVLVAKLPRVQLAEVVEVALLCAKGIDEMVEREKEGAS